MDENERGRYYREIAAAFLKLPEALGAVTLGAAASVTLLGLALLVARKSHPGR